MQHHNTPSTTTRLKFNTMMRKGTHGNYYLHERNSGHRSVEPGTDCTAWKGRWKPNGNGREEGKGSALRKLDAICFNGNNNQQTPLLLYVNEKRQWLNHGDGVVVRSMIRLSFDGTVAARGRVATCVCVGIESDSFAFGKRRT